MIIVDILIGWLVIKIVKERWVDLLSGENYCVRSDDGKVNDDDDDNE